MLDNIIHEITIGKHLEKFIEQVLNLQEKCSLPPAPSLMLLREAIPKRWAHDF